MIAYLHGLCMEKSPSHAIILVNDVGYWVRISLNTFTELVIGYKYSLHTKAVFREDAQELFGFLNKEDLQLFEKLVGVQGIGGSTALGVMSGMSSEALKEAIEQSDVEALKGIKGWA